MKKNKIIEEEYDAGINATIISFAIGTQNYKDAYAIRVHSDKYRLLILKDHAPVLGEVNGSVTVLTKENEYQYDEAIGFFTFVKNEFRFIQRNE